MNVEYADALAALNYDAAGLRAALTGRGIYVLADSENPATLTANVDGRLPLAIAWRQTLFWLDPDDTTSAPDDVSLIRTADLYVYKVERADFRTRSVIDNATTSPPATPANGDRYLVPSGAVGAWSSHQDDIAIYTENGWRFEVPQIGWWILVESKDAYVRYGSTGWRYGPGARAIDDASVPFSAALSWGAKFEVENQSTTVPPAATVGVCYIVGPAASGAWLGKDKQVAICEAAGAWTFYAPSAGWSAYDKSTGANYTYNGTAWISVSGTWIDSASVFTVSGSTTAPSGSNGYAYSATSAPTTSHRRMIDNASLTFAAKKAGALLRITYSADIAYGETGGFAGTGGAGIWRDNETNAIDWSMHPWEGTVTNFSNFVRSTMTFMATASDTSAHTYRFACLSKNDGEPTALTRRVFTIEERG